VELRLTADGVRVRDDKSVLDPALVQQMLSELTAAERREAIQGLALLAQAAMASMAAGAKRRRQAG
jgi:hypothetical protein